jgi:hypothetical protein
MSDIAMATGPVDAPANRLSWSAIILGALAGAALSFIFVSFGVAVGLGVSSAAPTWRDASVALWLLSGLYLIFQAVVSFAVAGYIAGWLGGRSVGFGSLTNTLDARGPAHDHSDLSEGLHGLAAWALAVVLGAALAGIVGSATLARSDRADTSARTSAAEPLLSYELDRLFRAPRRGANADLTAARAEAGRILLTSSSHRGVTNDDRTYLTQLVSGAGAPDAERRVEAAIDNAQQAIRRSRAGGIILAFSVASALLLGAFVAWTAAAAGSRHRDGEPMPNWMRTTGRPRRV